MKKILLTSTLAISLFSSYSFAFDLGINVGKLHLPHKQSTNKGGGIILGDNTPDTNGNSVEVYASNKCLLFKDDSIKNYISYTYSKLDKINNNMLLIGINKEFKYNKATLYAGVLAGYGVLKYEYDPLNSSFEKDTKSSSIVGGIQAGVKYPISDKVYFNLNTKLLATNYKFTLAPSNTSEDELKHKSFSSLSLGLGYSF